MNGHDPTTLRPSYVIGPSMASGKSHPPTGSPPYTAACALLKNGDLA